MITLLCNKCNKKFKVSPSKSDRLYCSRRCSDLGRTIALYKNKCAYCKKIYGTKRKDQRYCSSLCSNKATKDSPERVKKLRDANKGKYKYDVDKKLLCEFYIKRGLTIEQTASILDLDKSVVRNRLVLYKIPIRTKSETKLGSLNPQYGKVGPMRGKTHLKEKC